MTTIKLSEETRQNLIGKKIIEVGDNWIKLDNGCVIYLEESEIEMLN